MSMKCMRTPLIAVVAALGAITGCAGSGDDAESPTSSTSLSAGRKNETPAQALARLQQVTGNGAVVSSHKATGAARSIRLSKAASASLGQGLARTATEKANQSAAFFREFGAAVGVSDPASLKLERTETDAIG